MKKMIIEIKNEEELKYLWHCLNTNSHEIKNLHNQSLFPDDERPDFPKQENGMRMFHVVDRLWEDLNTEKA